MLEQGSGHVVNTGSISGLVPVPFQSLYSLTKYGVVGLSECLRYEYAEKGIAFSVICPSFIASAIYNKTMDGKAHGELRMPDDAYPADRAASYVLDRVAERKGIIIVPEEPNTSSGMATSWETRTWRRSRSRWHRTAGSHSRRRARSSDSRDDPGPVK